MIEGTDVEKEALLTQKRREGHVVICVATTPVSHGAAMMIPTPRDHVMAVLGSFIGLSPPRQRRAAAEVTKDVRRAMRRPVTGKPVELLNDLICLYVADIVLGPHVRAAAGLTTLSIAAEPDETLSWQERGMLDPDFMAAIGLKPEAGTIGGETPGIPA